MPFQQIIVNALNTIVQRAEDLDFNPHDMLTKYNRVKYWSLKRYAN